MSLEKAFEGIKNFVEDLWESFGTKKKSSPLSLYHRLLTRIQSDDTDAIKKAVNGFAVFFSKFEDYILNQKLNELPRGTNIYYGKSERVYIEIQKFYHQSDKQTKVAIQQHLLAICSVVETDQQKSEDLREKLSQLNIDPSSKEGAFIAEIMEEAKNSIGDVNTDNPTQAMMSLFTSGTLQKMMTGLQQGISTGEMNATRLLGTMHQAIGNFIPKEEKVEELSSEADGETSTKSLPSSEKPELPDDKDEKLESVTHVESSSEEDKSSVIEELPEQEEN